MNWRSWNAKMYLLNLVPLTLVQLIVGYWSLGTRSLFTNGEDMEKIASSFPYQK